MASLFMGSCKVILLLAFFSSLHFLIVISVEFEVGGDKGWVVPPSKSDQLYNMWASKNRFQVNDTLRFEYQKDSILVVSAEEYDKCKSTRPMFFSNNGDTVVELDRPGLFYFISGVSGHCERGLKMIVKVLEPEIPPDQEKKKSSSSQNSATAETIMLLLLMSFFGAIFM